MSLNLRIKNKEVIVQYQNTFLMLYFFISEPHFSALFLYCIVLLTFTYTLEQANGFI